ncbi:hypothetical protein, partial [Bifidobacterium saguinibicoloris]|uniref:hypothetical protein n=1 Tax=Bifidobacterium saguinibicoloris TaxID=2834433 RepID=UPI001C56D943
MGIGIAMILSFPERRPAATGRIESTCNPGIYRRRNRCLFTSPGNDDDTGENEVVPFSWTVIREEPIVARYTREQRRRAVELYVQYECCAADVI